MSEQVPAKIVFLTDGPSRTVRVGDQQIRLRQTTPRAMGPAGRSSGLVIQALRHLGQQHVDDTAIRVATLGSAAVLGSSAEVPLLR